MPISPITTAAPPPVDPLSQNPADRLRTEFITLLVAQLQNQDPLNPQDPSEFTSQLAQLASLEQMIGIGQLLADLSSIEAAALGAASASFIGKRAEVAGSDVNLAEGKASAARFSLPIESTSTTVKILDGDGNVVRTIELGPQEAGEHDFQWDGRNDSGELAADGNYTIEVAAKDSAGNAITADISVFGLVTGVRYVNGIVLLQINGREYSLGYLLSLSGADGATDPPPVDGGGGDDPIEDQPL